MAVAVIVLVIMAVTVVVVVVVVVTMIMAVAMLVVVTVIMAVAMLVIVTVLMPVTMAMTVIMTMYTPRLMRLVRLLRQRIIGLERLVVAVAMSAAVCADIRLERGLHLLYRQPAQLMEHVDQHRVVLELQVAFGDFEQDVAITQMIGRSGKLPGRDRRDARDAFMRRLDHNMLPVLRDEDIAVTQGLASIDRHAYLDIAAIEGQPLPASASLGERERDAGRVLSARRGGIAGFDEGVGNDHSQNRK